MDMVDGPMLLLVQLSARLSAAATSLESAAGRPGEGGSSDGRACAILRGTMARPSYDEETLSAYFHPASDDLFDDPIVGTVLRRLAEEDPDIIAAVADVDRSQIRDAMRQSPWERLQFAVRNWNGLARFRRAD